MVIVAFALFLSASLSACTSGSQNEQNSAEPQSATRAITAAAGDQAAVASRAQEGPQTFHGYFCNADCAGHGRGYEWADEHGIDDPHICYSGTRLSSRRYVSFSLGCEAYVDESTGAQPLGVGERYPSAGYVPIKSVAAEPRGGSTTAVLLDCSYGPGGCGAAGDGDDLTRPKDLRFARVYIRCVHAGGTGDQNSLRAACARASHIGKFLDASKYSGPLVFIDSGEPGRVKQRDAWHTPAG